MSRYFLSAAGGPAAASSTLERNLWLAIGVLFVVSFLPTTVFYLWGTSSHSTGVVIAAVLLGMIYGVAPEQSRGPVTFEGWMIVTGLVVLVLAVHLLVGSLFQQKEFGRGLLSLLVLAALLAGAFFVFALLTKVGDLALQRAVGLIRIAFVAAGVLGMLEIQPIGASELVSTEKSVFPFAEPSHFAVAFGPFLLHAGLVNRGWRQILWILIGYGMAYLLQNLSLAVATTLAALICLPLSRLLPAGLALSVVLGALNLEYFLQRLDLRYSQNISVLVYRQGWELVDDALQRTRGWGIGFQQLGNVPFNSPSADMLFRILRSDSNILDGGFLAAKLLSELGVIGVALIACYLYVAFRLAWKLRSSVVKGMQLPPKFVFSAAVICGFSIELFVRGLGYFSGSAMLLVSALLMMRSIQRSSLAVVRYRVSPAETNGTAVLEHSA